MYVCEIWVAMTLYVCLYACVSIVTNNYTNNINLLIFTKIF